MRGNPVAWREAHTRGNRTTGIALRLGFLICALTAVLVALLSYHKGTISAAALEKTVLTMLMLEMAVIVLVAIYMSAGAVSSEREDGTLDLLLTTPITPRIYVWGKLRGLVRFLALLLVAPISTLVIVAGYTLLGAGLNWSTVYVKVPVMGGTSTHLLILPEAPLLLTAILVPFTAASVIVGMSFSLGSKGVLGAIVWSVACVGVVGAVLSYCGYNMAANVPFLGPVVNGLSPATSILMIANPWIYVDDFARNEGYGRISLLLAAISTALVYGGFVYVFIYGMVNRFDHTIRRLSGTG